MKNLKPKFVEEKKEKSRKARVTESEKLPESASIWREEIKEMSEREFSSIDESVDFLAERVLMRYDLKGNVLQHSKEFLKNLLEDDEELVRILQSCIKIKR